MLDFLDSGLGITIYHAVIWVGIALTAGLVWIEWKRFATADSLTRLIAVAIMLAARSLALVLAPLQNNPDRIAAVLAAPLGYAVEFLCALLVTWTLVVRDRAARPLQLLRLAVISWGLLLLLAALSWAIPAWESGWDYALDSWQVAIWFGLIALTTLAGIVLLRPRWQPLPLALLVFLASGGVSGFLSSNTANHLLAAGQVWGRLFFLAAYVLYAFALYAALLHALDAKQKDLLALQGETRVQRDTLTALMNAARIFGGSFDLPVVLNDVTYLIARSLRADALVLIAPRDGKMAVFQVISRYLRTGETQALPSQLNIRDDLVLQRVLNSRKPQRVDGRQTRPLRWLIDFMGVRSIGTLWVQPLLQQDRLSGMLLICRESGSVAFSEADQTWIELMGEQVSATMQNIQAFGTLNKQVQELSNLLQVRDVELQRETAILESMAEGILVTDIDGRFILANRAAEQILGARRADLMGKTAADALRSSALQGGLSVRTVFELDAPYETTALLDDRRIRLQAAPLVFRDGRRMGVVAVLQDITSAYQAERARQDFIDSISNELRTPLTAIKGYTELMHNGMAGVIPPMFAEFLGLIRENTTRMTALTNNITALAEIERGNIALHIQRSNIGDVLRGVVTQYAAQARDKQLKLVLGRADVPLIDIDSNRMRLVVDNLLSNAVKFTPPGGSISVGCEGLTDSLGTVSFLSVWVMDSGPGLSAENQVRIWQSFSRVAGTLTMESGGLGIGLTIVKGLVEAHGGRVWVVSQPGQGCTFTLLLPVMRGPGLQEALAAKQKNGER